MSAMACPNCGHEADASEANFCQRCGGALRGPPCAKCNAASEAGDRFCNKCGAALPEGGGKGFSLAGVEPAWVVSGVLLLILIVVLVTRTGGGRDLTLAPPPAASAQGGALPDLTTMTPREAADRLFARVMSAVDQGDQAQADQFLPMAIAAYGRITPLNLDDRFHLSLLHAAGGDGAQALSVAEEGLGERSTHLLLLAAAAEAALVVGDSVMAEERYQALVDSFDSEVAAALPEYAPGVHGELIITLRDEAQTFLAGTSP